VRIAVVGALGQLGAAVVHDCRRAGHDVVPLTRAELDVTDDRAVADVLDAARPDAIVNCAAYNMVDAAEDHPVDALNVNAFAVRAMASAAGRAGAAFVHYGSDFVFDGGATTPYTEDVPPSPRSAYGASKMLGEWFALDAPRGYVLRVESLFGRAPGGGPPKGSVAAILNGLRAGTSPPVFEDRVVSPTYIIDAAAATRVLLERQAAPGIYHCVNSGQCTWLEFARELARAAGLEPRFRIVRMDDVQLRAQRPRFCALSNEKLRRAGFDMPAWQDAVARYVSESTVSG
jgi:dTDP-4-dehydrorhamnose reductase